MSITQIPRKIFNIARTAVSYVPGLKFLRKNNEAAALEEKTGFVARPNHFAQARKEQEKKYQISYDLAPKLQGFLKQVQSTDPNINDGLIELRKIVDSNITILEDDKVKRINYETDVLREDCEQLIDKREDDYRKRLEDLNKKNSNPAVGHEIDMNEYREVFADFFKESIVVIHNLNHMIFQKIIQGDIYASDLDIAEAFKQTRNISANLSSKLLDDFSHLLQKIPADSERKSQYSDKIKDDFKDHIRTLFQSSHFGILDRDLVAASVTEFIKQSPDTEYSCAQLQVLKQFQEGIHGCLVIKNIQNLDSTGSLHKEIASLDLKIIDKVIDDLNAKILQQIHTKSGAKEKDAIEEDMRDISRFLSSTAKVEDAVSREVDNFLNDENAIKLGISKDEINEICESYDHIYKINDAVGRTQEDLVAGERFPAEALINNFDKRIDFAKTYQRITMEASLLAAYDATAIYRGRRTETQRLERFKADHPSNRFKNFDPKYVPWLKRLYDKEFKLYTDLLKNNKTPSWPTSDIAIRLCELCSKLSSDSIGTFQSDDFFTRYELEQNAEDSIKNVGTKTDTKSMALALRVYSQIYSNVEKDAAALKGLTDTDRKWLARHIEFLKNLALIKDESGNPVYAADEDSPYEQAKFDEIESYFKKPGAVNYNVDLILKYFTEAITENKSRKSDLSKQSDIYSRNLLLSSALFYYYLKFIPEMSYRVDSLKSREKIINTMFNQRAASSRNLPKRLGPKILDHFFGTESDEKGNPVDKAKYKRGGFLRSYSLELQDKLDIYIKGDSLKYVPLNDLLQLYYNLEQNKAKSIKLEQERYPQHIGKDVLSVDKDQLGLWSKQIKYHKQFYGGSDQLLVPLSEKLKLLLKTQPKEVMSFISRVGDQDLKVEISKELFKQASATASKLRENLDANNFKVEDTDSETLKLAIRFFANLTRISNIMKTPNNNKYELDEFSILGEDNREEFKKQLSTVEEILNSRVSLIQSQTNTGENTRRLKNILINMLKSFKLRPMVGNSLEWLSSSEHELRLAKEDKRLNSKSESSHNYQLAS